MGEVRKSGRWTLHVIEKSGAMDFEDFIEILMIGFIGSERRFLLAVTEGI